MRLLLVIILVCLALPAGAADLSVFESGKARLVVEHSTAHTRPTAVNEAVDDLRHYFRKMTGVEMPVEKTEGLIPLEFRIRPAPTPPTAEQARDWPRYWIEVTGERIVIEAWSPLGVVNGIYALLDAWGCRWIMPGEIGEVIPKVEKLTLPMGEINADRMRDTRRNIISPKEPQTALWIRRNRNSTERSFPCYHNWAADWPSSIVSPALYNDPSKPDTFRPEYFALVGGDRVPRQICTTHPEVIALGIKAALDFFEKHPLADSFPADPNDNLDFCQCDSCRKLDPPGLTPEGLPKMTDRVVAFANEIARGIRAKYPGKKVGFYSYMNHTLPPERIKPEPEVIVGVTRSNYDQLRLTPRKKNDSASQFYKLLSAWKALGTDVFTYEYNPTYWNLNLFNPNFLELAQTSRETRKLGSLCTYTDGYIQIDNTTNFLHYYLLFRVNLDLDANPVAELEALCHQFYGPAGEAMVRYYHILSKVTEAKLPEGALFGGGIRHYSKIFNPEMIRAATAALEEAIRAVPAESLYAKRLHIADLNHRYLNAFLLGNQKAEAGDFDGSNAAFDEMERLIPILGEAGLLSQQNIFGVKDTSERIKGSRLMVLAGAFPQRYGMVTRWKMLGPLDNSSRGAEMNRDPFEPLNDIDTPVALSNGASMAWTPVESKSGFIHFRDLFGKTNPNWSAFYVYMGVKVTSPEKRRVELRMDSFNAFRVFLNGNEVYHRPGWDNDLPDKRKVPVILEKGENTIVVKCTHTSDSYAFPWGLYFRITDRTGELFEDLVYHP